MNEIRLVFGKPVQRDRAELILVLKKLQLQHDCVIQALDADKVVSDKHLLFAAEKAIRAFAEGRNIAKDLGVEILRYASGERQIERALSMGLSSTTQRVALILSSRSSEPCGRMPGASELSSIVEEDGLGCSFKAAAVKEAFRISQEEIEAAGEDRISDLVLERVALVDTYR